ncbi:hypothetical protein PMAYCL1PPCAC_17837 [Pristionchus mayeri]|uniref:G-protein coupled receptors family 1 profile domain-containing protein n=1 Tax=Pristionchus mayeri TaxID=1317129 RepID=A0AAN5CNF6_9BILA|nr:hypothetical protein PMAYCL1PPCAC_17837 [Pristionchus mayeri]
MTSSPPTQLLISDSSLISECSSLISQSQYEEALRRQKSIDETSSVLLPFFAAIGLTASAFSLLILSLSIYAIYKNRLPSRKYIVITSRTLGDGFSSLLISFSSLFSSSSSASFTLLALFIFISTFGFVLLSLSHLLVILLRQISLIRPHGFSSLFSLRKLLISLILIWLVSLLYAASFAPLTTVIITPSLGPDVCSFSRCQLPLLIVCIVLLSLLLLTLLSFYLFVLCKLRRNVQSFRFYGDSAQAKKQMLRFLSYGVHILIYSAISSLQLAGVIILLQNASLYDRLRNDEKSCEVIEYLGVQIRMEVIAGAALILWLVRILADFVILAFRDYRKLLPWIAMKDEKRRERIPESRSNSRAETPQRTSFNCPVFTLDKEIHRRDLRN